MTEEASIPPPHEEPPGDPESAQDPPAAGEPEGEAAAEQPPAPPAKQAAKKPRRWLRRLRKALLVLVFLALLVRAILPWVLPSIIDKLAEGFGLRCDYERLELSALGLDVELWQLAVASLEGGPAYLRMEYCRADVAVLELLFGNIVVRRLEVDGMQLRLERRADGSLPLLDHFMSDQQAEAEEEKEELEEVEEAVAEDTDASPLAGLSFRSPVRVDAARLQHLTITVIDHAVSPSTDARIDVDLRLSDLGVEGRPLLLQGRILSPQWLDLLRMEARVTLLDKRLRSTAELDLRGLSLRQLAPYLKPLGLLPQGPPLSVGGTLLCDLQLNKAGIDGSLLLQGCSLRSGREEVAALDSLAVSFSGLGGDSMRVPTVDIEGARLRAARNQAGEIVALGLVLRPPADTGAVAESRPEEPAEQPVIASEQPEEEPGELPLHLLPVVRIRNCAVAFDDQGLLPRLPDGRPQPLSVRVGLDSLRLAAVPAENGAPARIEVDLHCGLDGLFRSLAVHLEARPTWTSLAIDSKLTMKGLQFALVAPLLEQAGVYSRFQNGTVRLQASARAELEEDGALVAAAQLRGLRLADGKELLRLDRVRLSAARLAGDRSVLDVDTIQVAGLRLAARREADGSIEALGFTLRLPEAGAADTGAVPQLVPTDTGLVAATPVGDSAAVEAPFALPPGIPGLVRLAHLTVSDNVVSFADAVLPDGTADDLGLELSDVVADLDSLSLAIGHFHSWAELPDAVRRLDAFGRLRPLPMGGELELQAKLQGLSYAKAAPFLEPLGVEAALVDGSLALKLAARARVLTEGAEASLSISEVVLRDGDYELAGLDSLHVDSLVVAPGRVEIAAVRVARPRLAAARDAEGALQLLGLRLTLPLAGPPAETGAAVQFEAPDSLTVAAAGAPDSARALAPELALQALLGTFRVRGLALSWRDEAVDPPLATELLVDVELGPLGLQPEPPRSELAVDMSLAGSLEALAVRGTLQLSLESQSVALKVHSRGIRAGPLEAYLPKEVQIPLQDGRFSLALDAFHGFAPAVGHQAALSVRDIRFLDGTDELLRVGAVRALLPRIDLDSGLVEITELAVEGVATQAEVAEDGSILLPGLTLLPADTNEVVAAEAGAPGDTAAAPGSSNPASTVAQPLPELPLVHIERLLLHAERLQLLRSGQVPAGVSDFALRNTNSWALFGPDPAVHPALELAVAGRIDSVCESLRVSASVDAFGFEPEVRATVEVTGITGPALAQLAPQIEEPLDVSGLTDGRFLASMELHLDNQRSGPLDFSLDRGFGVELTINDVSFRNGLDGPVLLGLEQLIVDAPRIDLAKPEFRVASVEIFKPMARVSKHADGIHAAGVVLRLPPPDTTAPAPRPALTEREKAEAELRALARNRRLGRGRTVQSSGLRADNPAQHWPEFSLGSFLLSGIDVVVEDHSVDPPVFLPIRELDIELAGLSRRALLAEQALPFSLRTSIGRVPDPRLPGEEMIGMEGFSLAGNLIMLPTPLGKLRTVLKSLELVNFKGIAAQQGVSVEDGTLDMTVTTEFIDEGFIVDADIELLDLDVAETTSGLVASYLGLSAPLNLILFALENSSGGVSVPVTVQVGWGGISTDSILAAVVSSMTFVVAEALANVPLRLVGSVGQWFKFWDDSAVAIDVSETFPFQPVSVTLAPKENDRLKSLCERFFTQDGLELTLVAALGNNDLERAQVLANPPRALCLDLVTTLRTRKDELLVKRKQLFADARAASASQQRGLAESFASHLRSLDRELGELEQSLDEALAILRPGSERKAGRRTRAACLAISAARLATMRQLFIERGIPEDRIRVLAPRFSLPDRPEGTVVVGLGAGL